MSVVAAYRAKENCRAGGCYRKAGEEFSMLRLENVPAHLELIGESNDALAVIPAPAKAKGKASVSRAAQVGKDDIGAGKPISVADVTSADMVR